MFTFKIGGLDELAKIMNAAQEAFASLDGEIGEVRFDSEDPANIEAAIEKVESLIDERLGRHATNPFVAPLAEEMKSRYRQEILDKASEARLAEGANDEQ